MEMRLKNNPVAKELRTSKFRKRITRDKTTYYRKKEKEEE